MTQHALAAAPEQDADHADHRWLKRFGRRNGAGEIRLLCFHHAGGNAAMYRKWPPSLPNAIEPIAVQLPGRADRFREPAYDRMEPLIDDLINVVEPLLHHPFACYGVSMGARVAWAFVHGLRVRDLPMPRMLFVAASPAPLLDDGWDFEGREDDLTSYMRELGGTPEEVLAQPELLQVLMPMMKADFALLASHELTPVHPLDVPIHAFAGRDDPTASSDLMRAWASETTADFRLDVVTGGHFFEPAGERQVLDAIAADLTGGAA